MSPQSDSADKRPATLDLDQDHVEFAANAIRLSAIDWLIVVLIVAPIAVGIPWLGRSWESLDTGEDYRIAYALSNSYWTFDRGADQQIDAGMIPVVGDSVVWGEYVRPGESLTHQLNRQRGTESPRLFNAGLNGAHPLALQGLVRHYCGSIRDGRVIVHCNLLWMSSPERDLQTNQEQQFNHPRLVPQWPAGTPLVLSVPAYKALADERMGIAIDHHIELRRWVHHIRVAYLDGQDGATWSLEHPYSNPLARIKRRTPQPVDAAHSDPVPWKQAGIRTQDLSWIDLDSSLQWRAFRETVALLRERGNQVFVVVGPLNEHMLTRASRVRYRAMKSRVHEWLDQEGILHAIPEPLPSGQYGDASHPLADGYAELARRLWENEEFVEFMQDP